MIRAIIFLSLAATSFAEVGEALGWKYNHAPGIATRAERLTAWPGSLGPWPTARQIEAIVAEYRAAMEEEAAEKALDMDAEETARTLEELTAVLIETGQLPRAKVPAKTLDRINRRRARRGLEPL